MKFGNKWNTLYSLNRIYYIVYIEDSKSLIKGVLSVSKNTPRVFRSISIETESVLRMKNFLSDGFPFEMFEVSKGVEDYLHSSTHFIPRILHVFYYRVHETTYEEFIIN